MFKRVLCLLLIGALISGCSILKPYRPDIQQGNIITNEMVSQLRPGMTRFDVKYLLGTPVLENTFDPNQWIYIYTFKPLRGKTIERQVILTFRNNQLIKIQKSPELSKIANPK